MTAVTGRLVAVQLSEGVSMSNTIQTTSTPLDRMMAEVEKGQQLAGHFPDAEALERARRVYTGETSADAARAEIDAKYSRG